MGASGRRRVLDLRPTQFVFGMKEVEDKVAKLSKFKHKELDAYLEDHVVPCVIGPSRQIYLIDHHHFVHACWQAHVEEVLSDVIADKEHLAPPAFWSFMKESGWTYLHEPVRTWTA